MTVTPPPSHGRPTDAPRRAAPAQCYESVFEEGFDALPFAGHTLRPLIEGRLETCGVATLANGGCAALLGLGDGAAAAPAADGGFAAGNPALNQTQTMKLYSGAYSQVLDGNNDWGYYQQCNTLPASRYCVTQLDPPDSHIPTKWGICVPDSYAEPEVTAAINATNPEYFSQYEPQVDCDPLQNQGWPAGAVVVLVVWCLFAAVAVAASALGYLKRREDKRASAQAALANLQNIISPRSPGLVSPRSPGRPGAPSPRQELCERPWTRVAERLSALMCFDLRRNWDTLCRSGPPAAGVDLRVTNGLRVLSMWFVILGHTISYGEWFNSVAYPSVAIAPYLWSVSFFSKWYQGFFFSGWYSVDTFLFIGGLVCGSRASLAVEQHKQRHAQADTPLGARLRSELKFWGFFALSRWLRLLPSLVMVIVSFWFLVPSFGSSPWWQRHWDIVYGEQCGDYWWSTVLLIQNFIPAPRDPNALDTSTGICLGPSWYLAVDFQLHVFVAPLVLCTWHYAPQVARWARDGALHLPGTALIGAMLAATVAATAGVVVTRNCVLQGYGVGDFYFYYIKPWVRAPPYLFGLLLGLLLHNLSKLEPRGGLSPRGGKTRLEEVARALPKPAVLGALAFAVALMLTLCWVTNGYFATSSPWPPLSVMTESNWSNAEAYAYQTVRFFAWGLAMFVLGGVLLIGRGGLVAGVLSGAVWGPLAKLTYGAYLLQGPVIEAVYWGQQTEPVFFTFAGSLGRTIKFIVCSYVFGFFLYMLVEAPFGNLQKLVFGFTRRRAPQAGTPRRASDGKDAWAAQAPAPADCGCPPAEAPTAADVYPGGGGGGAAAADDDDCEDDCDPTWKGHKRSSSYTRMVGLIKKHTPINIIG